MKHAFRHFARVAVYLGPEGEASTGGGAVSPGRQPSAATQDRGIETIEAAMAEMDRRDAERRQAKRAEKRAAREEQVRTRGQREEDGDDGDATEDDDDPRRVEKKAKKADQDKPEKKGKADASDEADDDDESDDGAEGDADDEASDDDAETPDDEDAGEDDDGDDERDTSLDDDTEIDIEHEGEKRKVTLKELRKGYLRQADFTQKTTQLAQERQTVHQAAGQITAALQQLQQQQQHMAQFAQAMLGDEPSLDLATSDPTAYTVQKAIYDQRVRALQAIQHQAQQTQAQHQALQQQQVAMHTMRQMQTLIQAAPELRDPKKREAFTRDVVESAEKYGFSAQDVGQVSDHRMLLLLRDLANLQRGAQRSRQAEENVKKKLANVPPKLIKPGAASGNEGKSQKRAEARAKFMRSGRSLKDAMRVLAASD